MMGDSLSKVELYCDHICGESVRFNPAIHDMQSSKCPNCGGRITWSTRPISSIDLAKANDVVTDAAMGNAPLSVANEEEMVRRLSEMNKNFNLYSFIQTISEMDRLKGIMKALDVVQNKLYDPETLRMLDTDQLLKMHADLNRAKDKAQEFIQKSVVGESPIINIDNRQVHVTNINPASRDKLRRILTAIEGLPVGGNGGFKGEHTAVS
jgi:hypothetical protein